MQGRSHWNLAGLDSCVMSFLFCEYGLDMWEHAALFHSSVYEFAKYHRFGLSLPYCKLLIGHHCIFTLDCTLQ